MLGKFQEDWGFPKFVREGNKKILTFPSGFLFPLMAHCLVHALFTLTIATAYLTYTHGTGIGFFAFELALIDFVLHFTMDRIKAGPKYLGRFKPFTAKEYPAIAAALKHDEDLGYESIGGNEAKQKLRSNVFFWWSLGLDQTVHHLTHYYLIYRLVTA